MTPQVWFWKLQKTEEGAGLGGNYGGLWEHCHRRRSALGVLGLPEAVREKTMQVGSMGPLHRVPRGRDLTRQMALGCEVS